MSGAEPSLMLRALAARRAFKAGKLDAAVDFLEKIVAAKPYDRDVLRVLGAALAAAGRHSEALGWLLKAGLGESNQAQDKLLMARCYEATGDHAQARAFAARAVELAPNDDSARITLAGLEYESKPTVSPSGFEHLRDGDLKAGFASLLRTADAMPGIPGARCLESLRGDIPRWDGKPVDSLLVMTDQGFGDCIQFIRYAFAARQRVKRLTIATRPELMRLFANHFENVVNLFDLEVELAQSDAYITSFLLPAVLEADYEPRGSYLTAEPLDLGHGLNVGICWAAKGEGRSVSLADLGPLTAIEGVTFWSLQYGADPPAWMRRPPIELTDFQDSARAVAGCDVVLTVDTAVAHLAGALGIPVWIALPQAADWRWQKHDTHSPWYRTATLFRQHTDWRQVFERMAAHLENLARPWCMSAEVFTAEECRKILDLAKHRPQRLGRLHNGTKGGFRDESHYKARDTVLRPDDPEMAWVFERLLAAAADAERALQTSAGKLHEAAHLLTYGVDDHFSWHYDQSPKEAHLARRLSCSVQLSAPDDYAGGDLLVMQPEGKEWVTAARGQGQAIFFPSGCLHTVTPIRQGARSSLVLWIGGSASDVVQMPRCAVS